MRKRRTIQFVILSTLLVAAVVFAFLMRSIFNPLIVALILAYIFNPVIGAIMQLGISRIASIVLFYASLVLLSGLILYLVIPPATREVTHLIRHAPDYIDKAARSLPKAIADATGAEQEDVEKSLEEMRDRLDERKEDVARAGLPLLGKVFSTLISGINGLFVVLSYFILVPVYMFFILKGMDSLWENVKANLPAAYREQLLLSLSKIHYDIAAFFRGQIAICLIKGLILFIVLLLLNIKYSILLALLYAAGSMVPFLGVILSFTVTNGMVLIDSGVGSTLMIVVAAFVAVEFLEGLFLSPLILGKHTGLHPVSILLALFVFGQLFGVFGLMIAVPLASVVKAVFVDYILPHIREIASDRKTP